MTTPVRVRKAGDEVEVELRVDRGLFVRGSAEPVSLTSVSAEGVDVEGVRAGEPAGKRFEIGPLSRGMYEVHAAAFEAWIGHARAPAGADDVALELVPRGGRIEGLVVGPKDDEAVQATVELVGRGAPLRSTVSDAHSGHFRLEHVGVGRYVLVAHTEGLASRAVVDFPSENGVVADVRLDLERSGRLRLPVQEPEGGPWVEYSLRVEEVEILKGVQGLWGPAPEPLDLAVPAGELQVLRSTLAGRSLLTVFVPPGDTVELPPID